MVTSASTNANTGQIRRPKAGRLIFKLTRKDASY